VAYDAGLEGWLHRLPFCAINGLPRALKRECILSLIGTIEIVPFPILPKPDFFRGL
jgi:hypothetical protein